MSLQLLADLCIHRVGGHDTSPFIGPTMMVIRPGLQQKALAFYCTGPRLHRAHQDLTLGQMRTMHMSCHTRICTKMPGGRDYRSTFRGGKYNLAAVLIAASAVTGRLKSGPQPSRPACTLRHG
jgi:hypothetical protein